MPRLRLLRSIKDAVVYALMKPFILLLDKKTTSLLAKRMIGRLDRDDRAFIADLLAPEMSLRMGIPMPLASPLSNDVYHLTVEHVLNEFCQHQISIPFTSTLDLGCGLKPRNPFQAEFVYGVDIRGEAGSHVLAADLFNNPISFSSEHFNFVTTYDFIEHIPRTTCEDGVTRFPFILLMDEIWRVLKPGGLFMSYTPAFPSQQVFQDPTHVNPISENTFPLYFCVKQGQPPLARMYGFKSSFRLLTQQWSNFYLITLMAKIEDEETI